MQVNKIYFILFFAIYCVLFASSLQAQAQALAILDSTAIVIGDPIKLSVVVNHPNTSELEFPELQFSDNSQIEVLRTSTPKSKIAGNEIITEKFYWLTAWDSGFYQIPPIALKIRIDNKLDSLYTNPLQLKVFTIDVDTSEVAPIKDILDEHVPNYTWLYILVSLMLLAIVFLFLRKWRKTKETPLPETSPSLLPHELAFQSLLNLKNEKLWLKGDSKNYQAQLSNITRIYISQRYQINALESTAIEIVRKLQKLDLDKADLKQIKYILNLSDLVKFAKAEPTEEEHLASWQSAYDFVDKTKFVQNSIDDTSIPSSKE